MVRLTGSTWKEAAMSEEIGLFEAMHSQRAIRYFKPDPVPDDLIRRLLEAAIRAPSGANRQQWAFVRYSGPGDPPENRRLLSRRPRPSGYSGHATAAAAYISWNILLAGHLAEHMHEVPVLILACIRHDGSPPVTWPGAHPYFQRCRTSFWLRGDWAWAAC